MKIALSLIGLLLSFSIYSQDNSVLATGQWVRIEVKERGVHKISRATLESMGFNTTNLDPRNLVLYGTPAGMLPQANDANWPLNLQEIAIEVRGEGDGQFNDNDLLLFYATGADNIGFNTADQRFIFTKNLYAESSFYFLSLSNELGLRISEVADLGRGFPSYSTHQKIITHELDDTNLLSSGREWFGERMTNNTLNFSFTDEQITEGTGKFYLSAIAQSFNNSSLQVNANNSAIGSLEFFSIPNQQYTVKANRQSDLFNFESVKGELNLALQYDRNGSNSAVAYLDQLVIELPANNTYSKPYLQINTKSIENGISQFNIESNQSIDIWNVTKDIMPKSQAFISEGNVNFFSAFSDQIQSYWVFDPISAPEASSFELIKNQDLQGAPPPQFIIITHDDFMGQAKQMAQFREANDDMLTLITDVQSIYNEYSGGRQDVTAIRNFIKQKFNQSNLLQYVLFLGKGSYDYKNRLTENTNFVPTYESRNSIHPLFTYSSDDYFGFLEDHEGEWIEDRSGDHTLDIGIGRIPVTNTLEANQFLEKWLHYQSADNTLGEWRGKVAFVADDGDRNIHQRDADILATTVDQKHQKFNLSKLYLDAFYQEDLPNGERSIEAENALLEAVNSGTLLINFTGHGAESGWMQERILTFDLMEEWNNANTLPFLVTATCEFGRNDNPNILSGAEFLIKKANSGAIGLVTTARPVFSSTNFSLNQALYDVVLAQENGLYHRLGDIIQYTKNNSLEGSLNRNFILLGDPSLRLAYPEQSIKITHIDNQPINEPDTLKAFQRVKFEGMIEFGNSPNPNFNGLLNYTFLDKANTKKTLGTDSPVFNYTEKDRALSTGQVSVANGRFSIEIQVPKNIDYSFGSGRLQLYAIDTVKNIDALGVYEHLIIGGTSQGSTQDNSPPSGKLFLNNTSGILLKSYSKSVLFIAELQDENGINIWENGLGQNIELTLNDSISFNLNNFFKNDMDRLDLGRLSYNIENLPSGMNSLRLKFWDNFGNPASEEMSFLVEENSSIINEIKNYPNPLSDETNFVISHKLAGEDLDVKIEILNINGQPITAFSQEFYRANSELTVNWKAHNNLGIQLEKGVYIYHIKLRSKSSGLFQSKRKKLVISN